MAEIVITYQVVCLWDREVVSTFTEDIDYGSRKYLIAKARAYIQIFSEQTGQNFACVIGAYYTKADPFDEWSIVDWDHYLERQKHVGRMI